MKMLFPLVILFGLLNAGCAQKIVTINTDVDKTLDNKTGYLLMSVDTNVSLHSISIGGEKRLRLTAKNLKLGSNYIMVDIPAGTYEIEDVKLSKYYHISLEDGLWRFTINPGEINYIGNLNIEVVTNLFTLQGARAILENQSTEALLFLEHKFPNIYQARKLSYAGPGEDDFFQYARQLKAGVAK
jgi:hypothetical protein